MTTSQRDNRASLIIWTAAATLLALPAIAMRFTTEVNWTAHDFAAMAALLASVGGGYELLARRAPNRAYRAGAAVALLAASC